MKPRVRELILLLILGMLVYAFHDRLRVEWSQAMQRLFPCSQPITYTIGRIDPRFQISTSTVIADVQDASDIWYAAARKKLFAYDQKRGAVTINFVYDSRQRMTAELAN